MSALAAGRLLIVDDEVAQRHALCEMLALEGHVTRGVDSPAAALEALEPGQFDLLLTDLQMPGMDGVSLIHAARLRDNALDAIVMTGRATADTAVQAMQAGALDYVLKPFDGPTIRAVLARALHMQNLRRENLRLQERERARSEELAVAYRELEALAYSVSHDLRAPLRTIDGFSHILQEEFAEALGAEGRRITGLICEGARKMDALIVGLLTFSRAGRQPLSRDEVDMAALARSAADEMLAVHAGPRPCLDIGELPRCPGDSVLLRQVWCNLLGNAMKYSARRPEPQIRVRGHRDGPEAVYRVEDNGAGFDMRYAAKLFGVFQRLHSDAEFPGSGVGLAIAQRILARHGGRIWAEGEPNHGARFFFALPLADAAA